MLNNKYHSHVSKLHFNRWSNASFAIFHSIGREVIIGMVSILLEKLVTVKSRVANGFLKFTEGDFCEDEDLDVKFEQVIADELTHEIARAYVLNNRLQRVFLSTAKSKISYYKNSNRAHFGPFLFAIFYKIYKSFLYFIQIYRTK